GAAQSLSPEFDKLSARGVLLSNFYANGTRTSRALVATLSSFPPLPGVNLTKKIEAQQKMPTIAAYLSELGYRCVFMYGGDKDFEDMGGFVRQNGFSRVYDKDDFKAFSRHKNLIGVFDGELFEGADAQLAQLPQPFFAAVMTLTNHGPYQLPPDYSDAQGLEIEKRAFRYSDYALGRFFEMAEKREYFKNTIFIVMADHPVHYGSFSPRKFRAPLLFYSPLIKNPHKEGLLASQLDLPPTLLRLAGDKRKQQELPFWGQAMEERSPQMPVFCLEDPYFGVMTDTRFYRESLSGVERGIFNLDGKPVNNAEAQELLGAQARAALQLSRELFFAGKAGLPWKK
ncbi:MAG TPA: LTA synthase family protein, partial [Elusimicrobiales bacterium]|nr:LTA synthase family protein [Elusimicrobiales bacterium]